MPFATSYFIRRAVEADYADIVCLQTENHFTSVMEQERASEGFVSVRTDESLLSALNRDVGIAVAVADSHLVGYEFPLTVEVAEKMPLIIPFLLRLQNLTFHGRFLKDIKFIIEGQICIARGYKGMGIAQNLHSAFLRMLAGKYEVLVTEISEDNARSLAAHTKKLGMDIIDRYSADGRHWCVLAQAIPT